MRVSVSQHIRSLITSLLNFFKHIGVDIDYAVFVCLHKFEYRVCGISAELNIGAEIRCTELFVKILLDPLVTEKHICLYIHQLEPKQQLARKIAYSEIKLVFCCIV